MRIAIGQLWQETNTFHPIATTRPDFDQFGIQRGDEIAAQLADTNEPGGFIQSLRAWPERPDIVGTVRLPAWPAGTVTADTFAWIASEFATAFRGALPVDGVLIALHGAMAADGAPDVEGAILRVVRDIVGPAVPVVATLDLHANVTPAMVELADALVLFHTAPHIDVFETGQRAAAVLRRILIDGAKPAKAFRKLPMVVPAERANTQDPASVSYAFRELLQRLEADPRVLTAGLATVQPWLDVPELGSAVVVTTDGDAKLARSACDELADAVWARRREYLPELVPVADAVRQAYAECGEGLIVLGDSADATTSGAPGDSTHVLRELLKFDWPRPALVTLVSPEVVAEAERRGTGAEWIATLGGVRDSRFSEPIEVAVKVGRAFDAAFVLSGHLGKNLPINMGRSIVLSSGNIQIVVTSKSGPHFSPQLFEAAGLDPFGAAVLVAKSPCGFRAAYAAKARRILMVRAPGCAPADFWNYEYHHIPRPLWPWDAME